MPIREEKYHLRPVEIMNLARIAEAICRRFRRQVSLRAAQKLVADHEFLNFGGAQERRKVVRVQVPLFVIAPIGGLLVESHGIRESGLKQIVITNGDAAQDIGEEIELFAGERSDGSDGAFAYQGRFERRNCTECHYHRKGYVLTHERLVQS